MSEIASYFVVVAKVDVADAVVAVAVVVDVSVDVDIIAVTAAALVDIVICFGSLKPSCQILRF